MVGGLFFLLGFMLMSGLWIFSSKREHLLSVLLSLEYMVIVVYYVFMIYFVMFDSLYSLVYLIFTACEGALGLSILVMMSRTHGGDYFKSFNVMVV